MGLLRPIVLLSWLSLSPFPSKAGAEGNPTHPGDTSEKQALEAFRNDDTATLEGLRSEVLIIRLMEADDPTFEKRRVALRLLPKEGKIRAVTIAQALDRSPREGGEKLEQEALDVLSKNKTSVDELTLLLALLDDPKPTTRERARDMLRVRISEEPIVRASTAFGQSDFNQGALAQLWLEAAPELLPLLVQWKVKEVGFKNRKPRSELATPSAEVEASRSLLRQVISSGWKDPGAEGILAQLKSGDPLTRNLFVAEAIKLHFDYGPDIVRSFLFSHLPTDLSRDLIAQFMVSADPNQRLIAADVIAETSSVEFRSSLEKLLLDSHPYVRGIAASGFFGRQGRSRTPFERLLSRDPTHATELLANFLDPNPTFEVARDVAVMQMGLYERPNGRDPNERDPNPYLALFERSLTLAPAQRDRILKLGNTKAGRLGAGLGPFFSLLTTHPDSAVRTAAYDYLVEELPKGKNFLLALKRAFQGKDPVIVQQAVGNLQLYAYQLSRPTSLVLEVLDQVHALADHVPNVVRVDVLANLPEKMDDPVAVKDYVLRLLRDPPAAGFPESIKKLIRRWEPELGVHELGELIRSQDLSVHDGAWRAFCTRKEVWGKVNHQAMSREERLRELGQYEQATGGSRASDKCRYRDLIK